MSGVENQKPKNQKTKKPNDQPTKRRTACRPADGGYTHGCSIRRPPMSLKILLSGSTGKVGQVIEKLVAEDDDLEIVGRASAAQFFDDSQSADVLIDFSRPELCLKSLAHAKAKGIACVIGTTGLDQSDQTRIESASSSIPVCQAANFSIGINLLLELVERAAASLPAPFDVEISEIHHRWKVDAPSGTALALGRAVASARGLARGLDHDKAATRDREGARASGGIGYQSIRGGDVAGEHTVMFLGDGERIELTHKAADRAVFARGALHAARWLIDQPPGLYSMRDVLE